MKIKKNNLPEKLKFETISGKDFIKVKSAAKIAGIHPVILEMGQKLMESIDGKAASFLLGSSDMLKKATEIENEFRMGLKKVARAFSQGLTVKSYKDGDKLYFWYTQGWSRKSKEDK